MNISNTTNIYIFTYTLPDTEQFIYHWVTRSFLKLEVYSEQNEGCSINLKFVFDDFLVYVFLVYVYHTVDGRNPAPPNM